MTQRHELRWGGFAGVWFVILAGAAVLFPGQPPKVTASANEITNYVSSGKFELLCSSLLWATAAGMIIWFSAAFAEAIREREERSDVHMAVLAGSVLLGGAMFLGAAASAVLAYGVDTRSATATVTIFQGSMVLNTMIGYAAALPLAAAGVGVLRTRIMPDWLGYVAFIAAALSVAGAFGIFAETGNYVPGGPITSWLSLAAGGIFVLCASGFMVREHLPERAPMTLSQT